MERLTLHGYDPHDVLPLPLRAMVEWESVDALYAHPSEKGGVGVDRSTGQSRSSHRDSDDYNRITTIKSSSIGVGEV